MYEEREQAVREIEWNLKTLGKTEKRLKERDDAIAARAKAEDYMGLCNGELKALKTNLESREKAAADLEKEIDRLTRGK
jgi:biopolymer transport protein ExbB/TolQ